MVAANIGMPGWSKFLPTNRFDPFAPTKLYSLQENDENF
jgi:hypothetical protein